MKKLIDKLLRSGETSNGDKEKPSLKVRYFIILGLFGILLLLISSLFSSDDNDRSEINIDSINEEQTERREESEAPITGEIDELTRSYEKDLIKMLNKIQGVSDAEVMINLDSSDIKVFERNVTSGVQTTNEEDQSGGTRRVEDRTEDTQLVLVRQGDTESPILVQTKRPEIRGVFIVAKGVEQVTTQNDIINAISSVLDVPSYRISIMPKD